MYIWIDGLFGQETLVEVSTTLHLQAELNWVIHNKHLGACAKVYFATNSC